jgi:8-oxo-dGTP pyrophosphatase MutT (NUDIX family)
MFPAEKSRMAPLALQLEEPDNLFARSNMRGHLTSSCLVLNTQATKALLVFHLGLQGWFSPGGHYQPPQSMWESARREVSEETGVGDTVLETWCAENGIPLDIDTHQIPANPLKSEGDHIHHDLMYLAWADENSPLTAQLQEVRAARWFPLDGLPDGKDGRVGHVVRKCRALGLIV